MSKALMMLVLFFASATARSNPISFTGGGMATSRVAEEALRSALDTVDCKNLLVYSNPFGLDSLRQKISSLHDFGYASPASQILITASAQQALNLVFDVVLEDRDVVFVQEPTFFGVWRILRKKTGSRVVPFTTAAELLAQLPKERRAVVYLTSNFQSPSGRSITEKAEIARLLEETDSVAIEDNPYDLLHYDAERPSTIQSLEPERTFYLGSFSKLFGPGLRIGYTFVPRPFLSKIRSEKINLDIFTSTLAQEVASRMLARHQYLDDLRREFAEKRAVLLDRLPKVMPPSVRWREPEGGIFVELKFPRGFAFDSLVAAAKAEGLEIESDAFTYHDGRSRGSLRLNFVQNTIPDLKKGLDRLGRAYAKIAGEPREVIVTSGGTSVSLDDVRQLTNFSRGTTGALIAEEFLRQGYRVHFVHAKGSILPFEKFYEVNPETANADLERIRTGRAEVERLRFGLVPHRFVSFDDYLAKVENLVKGSPAEAIVLAAAVSDYGRAPASGKMSSTEDHLDIRLTRLPKVIGLVKKWNPKIFQVGFKLLSRAGLDEAIDIAYRSGIDNHSNLTLLNVLQNGNFADRRNVLITPEKGLRSVETKDVARRLVDTVSRRTSARHYRTISESSGDFLVEHAPLVAEFKAHVAAFWTLNVFEPYYEGARAFFGFFAMRVPQGGFLITARGSDKSHLQDGDIVYVDQVDFENRTVHALSTGKKASLNANVAAAIFAERSEVDLILHAHVFPKTDNVTREDFAPSTAEDVEEVMKHMRGDEKIVNLVDHGMISVGRTREDLIATLGHEPAYNDFPQFYDAMYGRFQKSTAFTDLVRNVLPKNAAILDLAAGTGEVARVLLEDGYTDVSLADSSPGMLAVAKSKLRDHSNSINVFEASMTGLDLERQYDGILIRQAVNYLRDWDDLVLAFRLIRNHLNRAGKLIFNAPLYAGGEKIFDDRAHSFEHGEYHVRVHERNTLDEDRLLTHAQRTVMVHKDGLEFKKLYDLNRFQLYTETELTKALVRAGFDDIKVIRTKRSLYIVAE